MDSAGSEAAARVLVVGFRFFGGRAARHFACGAVRVLDRAGRMRGSEKSG